MARFRAGPDRFDATGRLDATDRFHEANVFMKRSGGQNGQSGRMDEPPIPQRALTPLPTGCGAHSSIATGGPRLRHTENRLECSRASFIAAPSLNARKLNRPTAPWQDYKMP